MTRDTLSSACLQGSAACWQTVAPAARRSISPTAAPLPRRMAAAAPAPEGRARRDRKQVERVNMAVAEKPKLVVKQGAGVPLGEIENVAFRLEGHTRKDKMLKGQCRRGGRGAEGCKDLGARGFRWLPHALRTAMRVAAPRWKPPSRSRVHPRSEGVHGLVSAPLSVPPASARRRFGRRLCARRVLRVRHLRSLQPDAGMVRCSLCLCIRSSVCEIAADARPLAVAR